MGFWKRFVRILRAKTEKLLSKAEDPSEQLGILIEEMHKQLQEAKDQVALAIADEKRLKKQWVEEDQQAEAWETKAMRAVEMGDDELARAALKRKEHHEKVAREYQQQWERQKEAVDALKQALHQLHQKFEEAVRKKDLLLARQKRAEAQRTLQSALTGMSDSSAFEAFERMAHKIDALEATVEAHEELQGDLQKNDLEHRLKALESHHAPAEDALAALKAKMNARQEQESAPKKEASESLRLKETLRS